ncbi:hypothetical protein TW95_gp1643 [Pandoravirus inopinatum]|uniref:Uncharacterized protein n=1 Tax=Pandoravirus inopinatum TaxID=1605721 RepID=A0A0B5JEY2_9VIRU|nr:hypothetical protein TW95_gp1643 [Pandoravirus inopinatum]AJF98377.1 hypothetical protein [Pandoravirus inopinatum]
MDDGDGDDDDDDDGSQGKATTNYGLRAGDVERQWVFNSTTMDAWLDFGPFLDEFASCCAFVVRVPAGARGALILGRNSAYPDEYEMLLPYGCAFAVQARRPGEVTYRGLAQRDEIFYQDTTVYEVDYVPPVGSSADLVEANTALDAIGTMRNANATARVDLAKALATPGHADAVAAHPRLAAFWRPSSRAISSAVWPCRGWAAPRGEMFLFFRSDPAPRATAAPNRLCPSGRLTPCQKRIRA